MFENYEIFIKIFLALFLGGMIGLEREIKGKAAGLRTNILICLGAAIMMIISVGIAENSSNPNADPARIAAQVVTGVGFIGAGTIIQSRGLIKGLTSAAVIWVVAGLGLAIGAGYYIFSFLVTFIILITLYFLEKIENFIAKRGKLKLYSVWADNGAEIYDIILKLVKDAKVNTAIKVSKFENQWKISFKFYDNYSDYKDVQKFFLGLKDVIKVNKF